MFRKLWFGIGTALITAMIAGSTFTGVAFARVKDPDTHNTYRPAMQTSAYASYGALTPQRSDYGQVVSLSRNEFTIRTRDGQELNFRFDTDTQFDNSQKQATKESDLQIGKWVTVFAPHVERFTADAGMNAFKLWHAMRSGIREFSDSNGAPIATMVMFGSQGAGAAPAAKPATQPATQPAAPAAKP
jgi:hypothetical protein